MEIISIGLDVIQLIISIAIVYNISMIVNNSKI